MKKMKNSLLVVTLLGVALVGCTTREITLGDATYKSRRFGVTEKFGRISASNVTKGSTNSITVDGVQSDLVTGMKVGAEAVGNAVGSALKQVAK